MKKSTWAIISLSFCVWALLIVSGVLFVKYKTTVNQLRIEKEFEIANSVRDVVRKSGQPVSPIGMFHVDNDFVLTCVFKKPIEGNLHHSIGETLTPVVKAFYDRFKDTDSIQNLIISVRVPHRYSDGYKDWVPLVSFEFSKDEYESIIWKRFNPKWLLRFSKNIQWEGIDYNLLKKLEFFYKLKVMPDIIGS